MTLALAANIILDVIVFSAIVGMLAWAIRSSRPQRLEHQMRPVPEPRPASSRPTPSRPAYGRGARSRAHGSFERVEA